MRGTSLQRGRNLNAPVDGVRPNPEFGNVIEVISDARSRQDTLTVFFNVSLNRPTPPPAARLGGAGRRRRAAASAATRVADRTHAAAHRLARASRSRVSSSTGWLRNNTDGDFSVVADWRPRGRVGHRSGDIRHRGLMQVSAQMVRNLTTSSAAEHGERDAVHPADRQRRQRRSDLQRSARRRRAQHRAHERPDVPERQRQLLVHLRPLGGEHAAADRDHHFGHRRRRAGADHRRAAGRAAIASACSCRPPTSPTARTMSATAAC